MQTAEEYYSTNLPSEMYKCDLFHQANYCIILKPLFKQLFTLLHNFTIKLARILF